MIYADQRWIGHHGIGRFARHVLTALDYHPIQLNSNPAAPLDSCALARALRSATHQDLFFSPGYNTPLFCHAPFIFTIHDLIHVYSPENYKPQIRLYYATILKRACARAARILTVSEFTKKQIIDWSGVAREKVENVGCGVDPGYHPEGEKYGLPFPYLLSVSNRKPHKNEFRIVDAFAKAKLDPRLHLVFTGIPSEDLNRQIEKQQLQSRVDFVGVIPEERVPRPLPGRGGTGLPVPLRRLWTANTGGDGMRNTGRDFECHGDAGSRGRCRSARRSKVRRTNLAGNGTDRDGQPVA